MNITSEDNDHQPGNLKQSESNELGMDKSAQKDKRIMKVCNGERHCTGKRNSQTWLGTAGCHPMAPSPLSSIPRNYWEQPAPNWLLTVWGMHVGPHGEFSFWHMGQWGIGCFSGTNNAGAPMSSLGRVCRQVNLHTQEWGVSVVPKAWERQGICMQLCVCIYVQ